MKNSKEKFSIIMPAYNEQGRIAISIEEVANTFKDFGCSWELIIFDDGSSDQTYEKALESKEKYPKELIVKRNFRNIGKGRALKKSIRYATGDYIVFLDADMDLHPRQLQTFYDILKLDDADVVVGSKQHPNSIVGYPFLRKILSLGYYLLIRILFNLPCRDTQTGIKLFKAEVLRKVFPRLLVKKFAFDLELLVNINHLGYKIVEAPVVLSSQRLKNRISHKSVAVIFWDTLAVWYRMYVRKYYDRIDYHRRKNMAKEFRRMRK
ncbi:MAG: glycosyltransferase [Candidatus Aceula meridiana]|nr:glycosyltransferase [Candidatus Aceula meridiana]